MIEAPWTRDQVAALNRYQACDFVHPFTCPGGHTERVLTATETGWLCDICGYTQSWAHEHMLSEPVNYMAALHQELPFDRWAMVLSVIFWREWGSTGRDLAGDEWPELYREFYTDGYSPRGAFIEECDAGSE